MSTHWYAVNAQPAREILAQAHLERQSFETFLPLHETTIRHARRFETRHGALFPGYLFARFDADAVRWRAINGTVGVRGLVMSGGRPLSIPAGIVEALQQRCGPNGLIALAPTLAPGDKVSIDAGPFADLVGIVIELAGGDRVKLLLDLLNGKMAVSVGRRSLRAA